MKRFIRVVTVLEEEAHQRVGSRRTRPIRKRKKAAM
jgi:hypothetical protein